MALCVSPMIVWKALQGGVSKNAGSKFNEARRTWIGNSEVVMSAETAAYLFRNLFEQPSPKLGFTYSRFYKILQLLK